MLGVHWAGASWCQFAPVQFAVAPSGVQWLKLPPNWLVVARNGAKIEFGGKENFKIFEIFVAPLASSNQREVSTKWHQMAQTIRLLESTGM